MKFFLPKQSVFFALFKELNGQVISIAKLFEQCAIDFDKRETFLQPAHDIEHAADKTSHSIIEALNKTFVTPLDREDIYQLAKELDDLVDLIENVIQNIVLYQVTEEHPALKKYSTLITSAAAELDNLIGHLENAGKDKSFKTTIIKIHELEDEADELFQNAIAELFKHQADPIFIIQWKDILENLENILDTFQLVSDTVEEIVVKLD